MAEPMSAILRKVQALPALTPASFAAAFEDYDFDGNARDEEMISFWESASTCMLSRDKGLERNVALKKMKDFAGLHASTHFPSLNVNIVMYQMILRLLKPERVNQGSFGLCGPAHFTVILIKTKPTKYVLMAYDLLTKGKTVGDDGFEIAPGENVKNFVPAQSIPEADWLLAASIRNSQAPIPPGKEFGGYKGSHAGVVFSFFKHAGYQHIILLSCYQRTAELLVHAASGFSVLKQFEPSHSEETARNIVPNGNVHDPVTNFRIACKLREMGWRVMLSCNEDLFKYTPVTDKEREAAKSGNSFDVKRVKSKEEARRTMVTEKEVSPGVYMQRAGHWVVAKRIAVKGERVNLNVYTWGEQYTMAADVTLAEFANAYSGFVAAMG